jgi:hypothetical protein
MSDEFPSLRRKRKNEAPEEVESLFRRFVFREAWQALA